MASHMDTRGLADIRSRRVSVMLSDLETCIIRELEVFITRLNVIPRSQGRGSGGA